ncbi:cytochrome P450 [Acephala macrosclerotiorum]|nr:cytochrome P450 [Acephala macrosclerotiorum]
MWFGSIPAVAEMYKVSPMDTHPMCNMTLLSQKHKLDGIYYLDTWPFSDTRQLCVTDPEVAAQAVQKFDLPKYRVYPQMVSHVTGHTSMLVLSGPEWKKIRSLFNPGFAASHLQTLVPTIVDDVLIFQTILGELADKGEVTQIEEPLTRLTVDIMGHVILEHDLNSQRTENDLVDAFRSAVEWTPSATQVNLMFNLNPIRKFWDWWYARRMDNYLKRVIRDRVAERATEAADEKKSKKRPAVDLAIDEYVLAEGDGKVSNEFFQVAIDQIKTFMFAGHDTSSSTMCFIYHLLNLHPEAMAKVREEHDDVLGNVESTPDKLKRDSKILNELPYTTAVIKETLRLYAPASTAREGHPDLTLTYNGTTHPTVNTMVWINNHTMHHDATLFPDPNSFRPERFLPPNHPWHPESFQSQSSIPKDAYRPFEKGPRGCIGQELAMLELKIIMAMTVRKFDVEAAYEEWDRKLGREDPGSVLEGRRGRFGDRAYQEMKATAKPSDGMPARVSRREL